MVSGVLQTLVKGGILKYRCCCPFVATDSHRPDVGVVGAWVDVLVAPKEWWVGDAIPWESAVRVVVRGGG